MRLTKELLTLSTAACLTGAEVLSEPATKSANLADIFPTHRRNGRTVLQLTSGADYCYPLYYFIPSITADGRYLVYHRETPGAVHEIQLHRLDLTTGESVQLTRGTAENAEWQPWGEDKARGILGDRSALAPESGEVIYFDGLDARAVNVYTREDRHLFTVPADRFTLAQNCVTGDGKWFVYVHVDRSAYERLLEMRLERGGAFRENAHICKDTAIAAYNLETGEHRTILNIDYPVHHIHPYGKTNLAFSHIPDDTYGMGYTGIGETGYTVPRPVDDQGGKIIHHVPTARGIAYEVGFRPDEMRLGIIAPDTGSKLEWTGPRSVNHTGVDPAGRLFFYQVGRDRISIMKQYDADGNHKWEDLFGTWKNYGKGQKNHFHPQLVLDRQWLMMTGGDPNTKTNHIFLVDMNRLDETQNLSDHYQP